MGDVFWGLWLFTMAVYLGGVLSLVYTSFSEDSFFRALWVLLLSTLSIPFAPVLIGVFLGIGIAQGNRR